MLLKNYTIEIFKSKCQADAKGVHCFAHLEEDVSSALPYLNAVLGGFEYFSDPPEVSFKVHGKLIAVSGKKIAVNALKHEDEAKRIIHWLKNEINDAWKNKDSIQPQFSGAAKPVILEILKLLPRTNCKSCGQPTCLVFATRIADGINDASDCSQIDMVQKEKLEEYMSRFNLNMDQPDIDSGQSMF